ncbi:hypothetical protein WOLCODRAFT_74217 [Wolfiporia cocos MD-104 SS10]|uniref:Uncharacterized protein n=1 Tax=Wolfiporia cocos (strain MD-104) TaxID=742152 RepID=A0A2H3JL00_WOLCO|nr:hypothetical protein WOLCODRAFT_74217 [Wolfiporia cocos MD-104 SS10]
MSGPILQPISSWAESRISEIYTSTTAADFDTAFNNFLAENAQITVNGKNISRDEYKKLLLQQKADERNANVRFQDTVTVPGDKCDLFMIIQSGSVGVFFTATISTHTIIPGAVSASLNVQ